MARNHLMAIAITAIMRFFFQTFLLIISTPHNDRTMLIISNLIVFGSICWYTTKMNICPDIKSHLVLSVIETSMCIVIIEFLMGIWSAIECFIFSLIGSGFIDLEISKILIINDIIVMIMATCILLSVIIEGKLFETILAFYRENGVCGIIGCAPSPSKPQSAKSARQFKASSTLDPHCPIHGLNATHH